MTIYVGLLLDLNEISRILHINIDELSKEYEKVQYIKKYLKENNYKTNLHYYGFDYMNNTTYIFGIEEKIGSHPFDRFMEIDELINLLTNMKKIFNKEMISLGTDLSNVKIQPFVTSEDEPILIDEPIFIENPSPCVITLDDEFDG